MLLLIILLLFFRAKSTKKHRYIACLATDIVVNDPMVGHIYFFLPPLSNFWLLWLKLQVTKILYGEFTLFSALFLGTRTSPADIHNKSHVFCGKLALRLWNLFKKNLLSSLMTELLALLMLTSCNESLPESLHPYNKNTRMVIPYLKQLFKTWNPFLPARFTLAQLQKADLMFAQLDYVILCWLSLCHCHPWWWCCL